MLLGQLRPIITFTSLLKPLLNFHSKVKKKKKYSIVFKDTMFSCSCISVSKNTWHVQVCEGRLLDMKVIEYIALIGKSKLMQGIMMHFSMHL